MERIFFLSSRKMNIEKTKTEKGEKINKKLGYLTTRLERGMEKERFRRILADKKQPTHKTYLNRNKYNR